MPQDESIVRFPNGIIGFSELHDFHLLEPEGGPLKFLQSVDRPEISFTCMDAAAAKPDYQVPLGEAEAKLLNLGSEAEALVLVLVVPHEDPLQATANLAGPLVINTLTRTGIQVALNISEFPLKFPMFAPKGDARLEFPAGLLGFPHLHSFWLIEPMGGYPLKFMQSVEEPDISFTCIDVAAVQPEYEFSLGEEDAAVLALEAPKDALVLAMVVFRADPREMTANLAGPLVINGKTHVGRQIVLNTEKYPLKFPLFAAR